MLQRHSEAEWGRVGTERGTVRLRVRHGEAQCAAELGQVAPRAINQAQTAAGTGTGTGAGAGEGAEAAALSALRCMCAFVILLVVLARTHIIKARERERERVAEKRQSGARTARNARQTPDSVLW